MTLLAQIQTLPALHHRAPQIPSVTVGYFVGLFVLLALLIVGFIMITRKVLAGSGSRQKEWETPGPGTENASAFMTASMQGVIEKLRAQEKELARLHLLAQERAQESERLTEEVTRNMPTGLLLVNATGAIGSANPAAEEALAMRPLRYRSYREVLGADSDLSQMLAACLHDGKTFHRGEIEHLTREGEVRRLGVTISPIFRHVRNLVRVPEGDSAPAPEMKISGALCLMSDLTEITALQKQIRWKENLAALGEMSAGIAHEFKNALATISGYAQMIAQRSQNRRHLTIPPTASWTRPARSRMWSPNSCASPNRSKSVTKPSRCNPSSNASRPTCAKSSLNAPFPARALSSTFPATKLFSARPCSTLSATPPNPFVASAEPRTSTVSGTMEELASRKWQRICVSDNGPGIPDHDLPKIFLPFYTTKSEGTGLGLAVVQKVALQHGGSIEARNRQGGGAEFMLWLPLRQEPSPSVFPSQAVRL